MSELASSTTAKTISVSTGTYYIRICNDKTMEEYSDIDIQNYTFTITPKLRAEDIIVTEYNGDEGVNHYVSYPGMPSLFRTKNWIQVTGYVTAKDPVTGETYGVANHSVTSEYMNPNWEANHTPDFARRYGTAVSDSTGKYVTKMTSLPPAMGVFSWNAGLTIQYFDMCGISTYLTNKNSIRFEDEFYQYGSSIYN